MTGYYDVVLGLIPLALIGITGVLTAVGIALTVAVSLAAAVAVALIGHAMFVRAPVSAQPSSNPQSASSTPPVNSAD